MAIEFGKLEKLYIHKLQIKKEYIIELDKKNVEIIFK